MDEPKKVKLKIIERMEDPPGLYIRWGDLQKYLQWLIETGTPQEASVLRRLEKTLLATMINRDRGKKL